VLRETNVFPDYFKNPDPRQRGKVLYPLEEVLLLCLLAVLGGAETFVDIAQFGEKKIGLLSFDRFAMEYLTRTPAISLRRSRHRSSGTASSPSGR
jgi:hypothetical protein